MKREDLINAPAGGRLLSCLHEAGAIPQGIWHAYVDPATPDLYPLVQRKGADIWLLLEGNEMQLLHVKALPSRCDCGPRK